ncbi:MAG TPA: MFS transporter [Dactylosporangium sp.]|nr:MFS transporter [Dactylosporangium sp.]
MSAGRWLAAATLARTADSGAGVVVVLASLRQFGGPAQGSLVLSALLVPHVVAGPFLGLVTDRARNPRVLHACFVGVFGVALGGVLSLLGHAPQPLVLALALLAGCCGPMIFGGLSSRLDDVVVEERRRRFRGLDAATYNVADIAGPAAGAALAVSAGPPIAAAVLAGSCLCAAVLLLMVRAVRVDDIEAPPHQGVVAAASQAQSLVNGRAATSVELVVEDQALGLCGQPVGTRGQAPDSCEQAPRVRPEAPGARKQATNAHEQAAKQRERATSGRSGAISARKQATNARGRRGRRGRLGDELLAGMRAIVRSRPLLAVTVASCFAAFGMGMLPPIAVLLGAAHGRPTGGGVLITAVGVGALTGSLLVARRPVEMAPHRVALVCLAVTAAVLGVVPFVGAWPVLVGVFAVAGFCNGPLLTAVLQVRAAEAPASTRTQVFTIGAGLKVTAAAVGAACFAAVASWPVAVLAGALAATQGVAAAGGALLLAGRSRAVSRCAPSRRMPRSRSERGERRTQRGADDAQTDAPPPLHGIDGAAGRAAPAAAPPPTE